tara:strand:- start:104 stop:394 length:291 start_codon:yes stop_codon:yes gene_type:complete
MDVDYQFFLNVVIGIMTFFGGWILKTFWGRMNDLEEEQQELWENHNDDMKEQSRELNNLALSLPEKYVSKSDFDNLVKVVHHRFDRLEEKLDKMKK